MWFRFLRNGRACVRRQINKLLSLITRPTGWHAWLGNEHGLYLSSDKPQATGLCAMFFSANWCSRNNALGLRVRLSDSVEDSIAWTISLPWLVEFRGALDITGWFRLNVLRRITEQHVQRCYGFRLDRNGFGWRWHWAEISSFTWPLFVKGWEYNFVWSQLHGQPVDITEADEPVVLTITQPGSHGFRDSQHEVMVIASKTTRRWPRFWKQAQTSIQIDLKVDQPPAIVPGGHALTNPESIYGFCVRNTRNIKDAILEYQNAIRQLREQNVG